MSMASAARGAHGERLAAQWYRRHGYDVVDRNWRCRAGEIDLVVQRAGVLVFVEVKARSSVNFGAPIEAITATKLARLRRLAALWLREHARSAEHVRLDAVSVLGTTVEVIEGIG